MPNIVYVGTSIDGYIADRDGGLGFLECIPNLEGSDFGFEEFMQRVDAILMGRVTFEAVVGFGVEWPYSIPVFVLSSTMTEVPNGLEGKVEIVCGEIESVVDELTAKGFDRLYIDGGQVVKSFMKRDLVDELVITRLPVLLGGGTSLFADLPEHREFEHVKTDIFLDALVQSHYHRKR